MTLGDVTIPLWRVAELVGDNGAGNKLGLDVYPIYDETERNDLNRKILDHYWLREIGQETISMFVFMLQRTMNEIMPPYNQLYLSARIQFDPLATYKLSTVRNGTAAENSTTTSAGHNTSTTNSGNKSVQFDTPQSMLSGTEDYASAGAKATSNTTVGSDSTGTGSATGTTTQNDLSTTTGFQGSAADLLNKYRATILNIDMMVVDALAENFLMYWSNREILPQTVNRWYV